MSAHVPHEMSVNRRLAGSVLAVIAGLLGTGLIAASPARAVGAAVTYTSSPTSEFGIFGHRTMEEEEKENKEREEGKLVEWAGGEFGADSARGIAVNETTGDVYATDPSNGRVQVFSADGTYLFRFNGEGSPNGSFGRVNDIAIDNSSSASKGDVYIPAHGVVEVFNEKGEYLRQLAPPSPPFNPELLTVDPSGNVWVVGSGESGSAIFEFTGSGEYVTQLSLGGRQGIAVDASNIYSCCVQESTYEPKLARKVTRTYVVKYNLQGSEVGRVDVAQEGEGQEGYLAVNQVTHQLFFVWTGSQVSGVERFGAHGEPFDAPIEKFGFGEPYTSEEIGLSYSEGVAINDSTGTIYVGNHGKHPIAVFEAQTAVPPLLGAPLPAASVTRTSATLTGALNPRHNPVTYQFEYGPTSSYGAYTSPKPALSGGQEETVEVSVKGLAPDTTYHYALIATSAGGTSVGPEQTFTTGASTPPTVTNPGGASEVALTSATLTGAIDPNGLQASYELQFGTTTEYGTSIDGEVGEQSEGVPVAVPLQGLEPGTTYHYRFVGVSGEGRTYGPDETFTTPAYDHPIVLPPVEPQLAIPAIAFPTEEGKPVTKTTKTKKKATKTKKKTKAKKRAKPGARRHTGRKRRKK